MHLYQPLLNQKTAGLQKWILDSTSTSPSWHLVYTIQAGLGLGIPNTISGYPTGNNPATGIQWAPATDGLRNITGRVNGDGTVTIWAITSTVSGSGDPRAPRPRSKLAVEGGHRTNSKAAQPCQRAMTTKIKMIRGTILSRFAQPRPRKCSVALLSLPRIATMTVRMVTTTDDWPWRKVIRSFSGKENQVPGGTPHSAWDVFQSHRGVCLHLRLRISSPAKFCWRAISASFHK